MSTTLKLSILVFIILLPLAYYGTQKYVKVPPPVVPPVATFVQVDEHLSIDETLKEVNFCGTMYKVKQVKIDGVDVVQRVAELATKGLVPDTLQSGPYGPNMNEWRKTTFKSGETSKMICSNIRLNATNGVIKIERASLAGLGDIVEKGEIYTIFGNGFNIVLYLNSGNVYLVNDYAGGVDGPIGKLR